MWNWFSFNIFLQFNKTFIIFAYQKHEQNCIETNKTIATMPKYINPVTDFGFKRIFKDEEITRGFLNALLQKYDPATVIKTVTITDGELDETSKAIRRVVYDVHCTTDTGEEFVIEMQNEAQEFFQERIVYYLARSASRQQTKGVIKHIDENGKPKETKWNYNLKRIYGVFFMNFKDMEHPQPLSHFALLETEKHYQDTDVFQYWKIQMPLYREMKESDCKDDIDKWIYNLSNMETMETQLPFASEQPLFVRLGKLAAYSNLSAQQQIQYDDSYNNYLAYMGAQEYQMNEGIRIGIEKGEMSKAITIARNLKAAGLDISFIAQNTGLTTKQIQSL